VIAVAVTAAHGAPVGTTLAALEAARVTDPFVAHAPPGEGLASARNAALEACGDAEVLALVEDDVLVDPGWLAALTAAWEGAGDDVACIGGPVAGALDYGGEPLDLDPSQRTLLGANVSFRTDALRGVEGFWPARGHPGARDWYSEEHLAQRELARAGWTLRYAPEVRARREEPARAREALKRRLHTGARGQLLGRPRAPREAVLTGAKALAGVPVAIARRDREQALDRAGRAAQAAGALLGRRIASGDLEPTVTSTPFRASVPSGKLPKAPAHDGPLVLLYHRVADVEDDPLGLAVSPLRFAAQLAILKEHREVVPLQAVLAGEAGPRAIAVTFDDGYHDNLLHALPALRRERVPATIYISTGHVETGRGFWWDAMRLMLRAASEPPPAPLRIALGEDVRAWPARDAATRDEARRHLHAWLQPRTPEEIDAALAALAEWAGHLGADKFEHDRPMTPAELRRLAEDPLVTIGAHTRTHRSLRWASPELQREELRRSRADLAGWLGTEPDGLSYPFGVPGADFDETTKRLARELGFAHAVANRPGRVSPGTDPFDIPRTVAPDLDGRPFAQWLESEA